MLNAILTTISEITKPITGMIDDLTTTDEEKLELKNRLKQTSNELAISIMEHEEKTIEGQKEVITAEIKSGWLSRSWRPILMLSITAIVINNYILYPYLSLFTDKAVMLDLPAKLWDLMTVGVGGYIVGRSGEKITKAFKKK